VTAALRIGINLVFLTPGEQGGMEVYVRELLPRLAALDDIDLTVFAGRNCAGGDWGEGVREVLVDVDARDRRQWVLGEQLHLPRLAERAGVELVHSPASTAPLRGRFVRVTTIHDLNYKLVPGTHSRVRGLAMRTLVPAAARRSQRIIVDAASTARDLHEHLGVPAAKIDVVPLAGSVPGPATAEPELRARLGLGDRPVLLSFSAKRPHKNLMRLIEAHALLASPRPLLVLPGYRTPHEDELRARAAALGTSGDVIFPAWIDDADREGLYALAELFVFPSLYEGFGLPPLEAMARGVPVITTDRGSLAEVAGQAAWLVDPLSVDAIATAIRELLSDGAERERLRALGREQAARFSWELAAELTAASYRRALSGAE